MHAQYIVSVGVAVPCAEKTGLCARILKRRHIARACHSYYTSVERSHRQTKRSRVRRTISQDIKMLVKSNSEYDSFLYWRQPISAPDLSELEDLGVTKSKPTKKSKKATKKHNAALAKQRKQQEAELLEYTTFNYWREPIPSIDLLDFNLLL